MCEREMLRELAKRWMEISDLPAMKERKRQWKALKDLKAERPMILVETNSINSFFDDKKLSFKDPFLRSVEKTMRETIEHFEDVGDDIVLEPYYRIPWKLVRPDYGMPL
ncbi:MAG: hypothetical protein Q7J78_04525, partial [Clostridiales bacterium]|nr:hypothetical protein [Clostridiales bacterium]